MFRGVKSIAWVKAVKYDITEGMDLTYQTKGPA